MIKHIITYERGVSVRDETGKPESHAASEIGEPLDRMSVRDRETDQWHADAFALRRQPDRRGSKL